MEQKEQLLVQETAQKLLTMLGVTSPFVVNANEDSIEMVIETEENGMLIGYHGETLEALQLVLSLVIAKALGRFVRVSVEVGEYKKNRMEYLQMIVAQTKERVLADGQGVALANLKSWERRFVHTIVAEDGEIISESSGEGRDRVLTIFAKN